MTMTPEEIKNHIGEVWEDDNGLRYWLIAVLNEGIEQRIVYLAAGEDSVDQITVKGWLSANTLPQSLRKPSPRMVKAPEWVVLVSEQEAPMQAKVLDHYFSREQAENMAKSSFYKNVAIQQVGSDEMEVIKGFEEK